MTNGVTIPVEQYVLDRVSEVEARFNLKLEAAEAAKKLQAFEYERRLAELNNSHETAVRVQNTFATKEAVERETETLEVRVGKLELARANRDGTSRVIGILWGFGGATLVALIVFFVDKAWK